MSRSQETFNKKEVRNKKEKKRKEKELRRQARKDQDKKSSLDDMIAYVDENGMITDTPPDPTQKSKTKAEDIQISIPKKEDMEQPDPIRNGKISYFNHSKGYGFIRDLETQESVFFHVNNTLDEVNEADKVTFEVEQGPKGPSAVRVKLKEQ